MPQVANGGDDVGLRVAYVAGARGVIDCGDLHAFDFLQERPRLVQGDAPAVAGVVAWYVVVVVSRRRSS